MEPANILIVEDERITADNIDQILQKKGYKTRVANTKEEALEIVQGFAPDVILMDIHLHGKIQGIAIAKTIRQSFTAAIIYITQFNDEKIFQDAKETFPSNYLIKPFSNEMLLRAIELAIPQSDINTSDIHSNKSLSDRIFMQTKEGLYIKLLLSDILYLESWAAYTKIFFAVAGNPEGNFYLISKSSNNVYGRLEFYDLVRVHKSYYVNISKIERIKDGQIHINGTTFPIPVSRDFRPELDRRLKYMKHNSSRE